MHLPAEEPLFDDLQPWDDATLVRFVHERAGTGRPLVLVDGRSGGGKTTLAARLATALGADIVCTDDVAWYESFFGWDDLLADHVITPWRAGDDVRYRPQAWDERNREGAITCSGARPLVIEGVGSARPTLRDLADVVVWVQSDEREARRRGIDRDVVVYHRSPQQAEDFWEEWQSHEDPFQAESRPWEAADLVVRGTSAQAPDGTPSRSDLDVIWVKSLD
ncbi:uridine kinase family protein [Aestuariimicrobium ganziense]|uniref:uridine kinase family protein n=1 Tax=Aestuariimicrobium ganziense TaxID=2773677 RepID=UPI001943ED77|nr:hypothetical protein [Aestuariimicrobium ganziense]